nr:CocE/NonD family hydrolase [Bradyrhizobium jicamae]
MSDGARVAVRIYRPEGPGPFPTLFAASPYRYDNDDVPPSMIFYWHETGPIDFYVERGYAYVHLDVRGTGKSEGEYGFFSRRERRDLYEVIEWIAAQPWSSGKIGGIGQSYYAAAQWCMAAERPQHLTCVAPFDGHIDFYNGWFYQGGIQSQFASVWWNGSVRLANRFPANGSGPRIIEYDLIADLMRHPIRDDYWEERTIVDQLSQVDIPVYSIGIYVKRDIHLDGNIIGYNTVRGPKKLRLLSTPTLPQALAAFASTAMHEEVLLPFYDCYLKGTRNEYLDRPNVEFDLCGSSATLTSTTWPPVGVEYKEFFLGSGPTGSVTSMNDGTLQDEVDLGVATDQSTEYSYPDSQWAIGPVAHSARGPDLLKRMVTFASAAFGQDIILAGWGELVLFVSSTRDDANFIVKLSEQFEQPADDRAKGIQPQSILISKGWLRASQRAIDEARSVKGGPVHFHTKRSQLVPGQVVELRIPLTATAYKVRSGSRVRIDISCADSTVTDLQFSHAFTPDMVGKDTIHHGPTHPSRLILPTLRT